MLGAETEVEAADFFSTLALRCWLLVRGRALLSTHDAPGATASLEAALALRRANDLPGSLWHEQAALALADAWAARGRPDLAIKLRAEVKNLKRVRSLQQADSKNASKASTHAK